MNLLNKLRAYCVQDTMLNGKQFKIQNNLALKHLTIKNKRKL